ncbi:MAG: single-stranded DNA-binding protein [Saprospiraceae bacterium]|nr:single-stranded DNA-binding protein [Saprospiraceae bacterium]
MVNKVTLIGRLGKDPEVRTLENGTTIAKFSLATNESYKDKVGEWQTITEWHNIIMWREVADRAEKQLKKGYLVYVDGKLTNRSWQDENGNTKYITEVRVNSFRLLKEETNMNKPPVEETTTHEVVDAPDVLPF